MITIEVERVGNVTDSAHLTIEPGQVVKLTMTAEVEDDEMTPRQRDIDKRLESISDLEILAYLMRRLEAR
jgi:hypothetical protein